MKSGPTGETLRDRLIERRDRDFYAASDRTKPRLFVRFMHGKLRTGWKSDHRLRHARLWRTRLRIKARLHPCALREFEKGVG